jgi:omega-hydroxy-beta-dihydromenaquinone-9 sulfotransferase
MKYFSASFYYVRYSILGKIIRETYRHFKWRIWLLSVGFIFLYSLNQFIHLIFRLADEIFFRGYKKKQIKAPVFIISNPRSGTTYLHRLISLDKEHFVYTKYAHTFQMTASFVKVANAMKWIDVRTGNYMRKAINHMDDKLWKGWDDMHPMGFNKAEEDELVFAQTMMSTGIFIPFPYFHLIDDNKFLDREPEDVRKNVMDFYESCLKRFLYAADGSRTYLAKNVMSTGRFKTLLQRFPDARIIYVARHPYEAVPSFASMFTAMYKLHSPDMPDNAPPKKAWAQLGIDYFKYSQEMKKAIPPAQFIELKYDDLLNEPQETVLKVYRHFNWQPSDKFLERLGQEQARNKDYKSAHEYTLEQYGFTKEDVCRELGDIMDELGFAREEGPAVPDVQVPNDGLKV